MRTRRSRSWRAVLAIAVIVAAGTAVPGFARKGEPPRSRGDTRLAATEAIPTITLPAIDAAELRALAEATVEPGPYQVAEGIDLSIDLEEGLWETVPAGRIWRVRIVAPGALHLNFGFGALWLPEGATLHISSLVDETAYVGPYDAEDKAPQGLWTPMVPGDSAVIELFVPAGAAEPVLEVTHAGLGFVDLFRLSPEQKHELDACHIDVVCPQSFMDDQERAVARLLIGGTSLCTGTLLNDVGGTRTPYVLTADHCGITAGAAPTVVALFNFWVATCGSGTPGPTTDTVSGSTLRATRTDVDGTLIELSSSPPAGYNSYLAGWDRSNTTPSATTGIHHPFGTSMAYCEDTNPPTTVNNCIGGGGVNSHWEATWTLGTTTPGSSGSALFDFNSSRVIGHLSGGLAACDNGNPNGLWDCYGKLAVFWDGPSSASRLRDWLDPGNTGTMTVDGLENNPPGCTPDAFEPDDSSGSSNILDSGVTQTHSICPVGDEDWMVFFLPGESGVVLETSGPGGGDDTRMWLYDQSLSEIEFDDDGGTGLYSRIDRTTCGTNSLPFGVYYVKVDEFANNDEIASYDIDLTVTPCPCIDDGFEGFGSNGTDDTCFGSFLGSLPATQTHAACDEDWVYFASEQGKTYLMETENLTGGSDTTMALHDACGPELLFDDDGGMGLASLLQWTANSTTAVDLRIRQYADQYFAGRGYDITVSEICLADLLLTDQTVSSPVSFIGDDSITTGPAFLVTGSGAATLTTGGEVVMRNDTTVEGELTVELTPSPCPLGPTVVFTTRGDEVGKKVP